MPARRARAMAPANATDIRHSRGRRGTRRSLNHVFRGVESQGEKMSPTLKDGKICYVEFPAVDAILSADFYANVFGWGIRKRGDGKSAFDDSVGEVSGTWVTGRKPAAEPGLLVYVMVDDITATIDAVIAHGGKIVQPVGGDAPEITARFKDP